MILEHLPAVRELSGPEKLLLAEELWDEVAKDEQELPLTPEQIAELDRRMENYRQSPGGLTTFEEIKARLKARKRAV